jgi:rhodanese-related sulfurtransferase/glyoxylase-like metal-dependent hydrolase (beta-lactamase superfamily II)
MPGGVSLLKYPKSGLLPVPYLLADQESGTAAMIDPNHDVELYLEDAWRLGTRIKHVFLTQLPAGVPSSLLELRERASATVYAGAWGRPEFEFMPLKDGDALEFGRVRLRIAETPGHRLEAIVLLLYDCHSGDPNPYAAFTGETVMVGDVGRPDPQPADGFDTTELASMLHGSLRLKILSLPDTARIFPSRESSIDLFIEPSHTIGAQRGFNPGFQLMSRDEFVRRVCAGMLAEPASTEADGDQMRAASVGEILRAQRAGAQIVDMRDPEQFAAGQLAGSLNLPAMAAFEDWAGAVVDRERPIVLVAPPGRETHAASRLSAAGFGQVASYLRNGERGLEEQPGLIRRQRRISFAAMGARLIAGAPSFLLDTRAPGRGCLGPRVLGYTVPLEHLRSELGSLPRGPEIIVCDDTPYRSSAAASLLRSEGFPNVTDVAGGLALWGRD